MIEIYFDGELLDNSNYMGFNINFQPFEKEFYLGSTGSINASLTIPKEALPASPTNVVIKINGENWYHCVVDSIEENDNEEYILTLLEIITNTEVEYDFSDKVPISAKTLLENICSDFNIPHDEFNFTNQNVEISSYDGSVTAREYLSMIGELAGGYIIINNEGKLEVKTYLDSISNNIINADDVDTFKIKNTITIQRVVWQFVSEKKESSNDSSLYTIYLDGNNLFLQNMTDEIFNNICNNIIGLSVSNIKISTTNKFFKGKDIIKFVDRENNEYNILPFFEADYNGGFVGSYESNIENAKQNETRVNSTAQNVRRIKQTVDQDSNTLKIAVEDIKVQKEVTNDEFNTRINKNASDITQSAADIRFEVSEKEQGLRDEIGVVQKDLDNTEDDLRKLISNNTSDIEILSKSITSTVKSIGGNNLLRNSVGFATTLNDDNIKTLDFWKTTNPQNITSIQDADTESTTVSGSKIVFNGIAKIEQEYVAQIGMTYGISLKLKHKINGGTPNNIKIYILGEENQINVLSEEQSLREYSNFTQLSEFTYMARIGNPKIVIETDGDDLIEISDLIISQGENQAWSCYFDEVYGKEHRLDKYGLKLTDLATGDYSEQTINGLKFVDDNQVVSEISKNQAKSDSGKFVNDITLRKLQWVVLDEDNIIEYIE
jgi:hypothetical protein